MLSKGIRRCTVLTNAGDVPEATNVANSLRIADLVSITLFAEEQLAAEGKILFDRVAADQRVEVGLVATGLGT